MGNRVSIVKDEVLYEGWSSLRKVTLDYVRSDGRSEKQVREIFNSGDGAAVLLYNPVEKIILVIRQFRLPVMINSDSDGFIIECCAGLLDDLDPETAIIKEIREETGYQIDNVKKVYEAFATPGAHLEKIHYYVAEFDESKHVGTGGGLINEQEDIEILKFGYNEIPHLLQSGKIVDTKTIVLLQWALLNLN